VHLLRRAVEAGVQQQESADDFGAYLLALLTKVADAKARPVWKADSFFKRFDTTSAASAAQP
jgi:hypothetical protein